MNLSSPKAYYLAAGFVILATLAGILVAYPKLPATVPVHWNAHGHADGFGPKWSLLVYGPGLMTATVALFALLPWLSPKKFEIDNFRATYLYIMIVLVAAFAYIQILVLMAGLGLAIDVGRAVIGGVCLLIALLGNVLGKVRRNFYVGVRTPWTIADERVWNVTHRFAAKTFFIGGLFGLVSVVFRAPAWFPVVAILAAALIPAVYSLIYYKQLEHSGQLNR